MSIKLAVPEKNMIQLKPRISVIGVGGGGGNAVNNMIEKKLEGVDFIVANTDAQALENAKTQRRIQLGLETTKGLGAGARPEVGKMAAEEAIEDIKREIEGANMVFITAGMGGGTGSGAAPVVAKIAKEQGILTVGVVTKPFQFEGKKRSETAENALINFTKEVDSIIVIPNQNLFRIADKNTTLVDAFVMADNVLYDGVRSITDLMMMPGLINLDFADVKAIMEDKGKAIMGTGEAEGEDRAVKAAEQALANPLLDDCSMHGAKGVLINITASPDMKLMEVDDAVNRIKEEVDEDANIIFGSSFDASLEGKIRVSIVATGIDERIKRENFVRTTEVKEEKVEEKIVPTVEVKEEIKTETIEDAVAEPEKKSIEEVLRRISENEAQKIAEDDIEEVVESATAAVINPSVIEEPQEKYIADFDKVERSNIYDTIPNSSSLFKAIINKESSADDNKEEMKKEEISKVLEKNENFFEAKTQLKNIEVMPEEELELFPNHNPAPIVNKQEEPETLIVNENEPRKRTFLEIMTGRSIAKKNRQRENIREQEPIESSFEENNDNDKVNLEIPAFLRRK